MFFNKPQAPDIITSSAAIASNQIPMNFCFVYIHCNVCGIPVAQLQLIGIWTATQVLRCCGCRRMRSGFFVNKLIKLKSVHTDSDNNARRPRSSLLPNEMLAKNGRICGEPIDCSEIYAIDVHGPKR